VVTVPLRTAEERMDAVPRSAGVLEADPSAGVLPAGLQLAGAGTQCSSRRSLTAAWRTRRRRVARCATRSRWTRM